MKFDTIIIGGGLAGLVCGIRLQEQGQRCVIVSSGQSALHFSSGSFDLLGKISGDTDVDNPLEAMELLDVSHPYRKIGIEKVHEYADATNAFMKRCNIFVQGDAKCNHYRMTPMGMMKKTWLTLEDFQLFEDKEQIPWRSLEVVNFEGFLDFYTQFIADSIQSGGVKTLISSVSLNAIENLRRNPTEMRSANLARVFDSYEQIDKLVAILLPKYEKVEAIVLPAVFGITSSEPMRYLKQRIGRPLVLMATMPPSVPGIRTQQLLRQRFVSLGGTFMMGDTVDRVRFDDNNRVKSIYTTNHGDIEFSAGNFVLASGNFFSRGIIARPDSVYEPIFNLDVRFDTDRASWYEKDVFAPQPYMNFGVETDENFHGLIKGKRVGNLHVIGSVLGGFNPLQEGSGAGVSILSAMNVAHQIVK